MELRYGLGLYRCISTLKFNDANSSFRTTTPNLSHLGYYFPRSWDKVLSDGLDHLYTDAYPIASVENNTLDIKHSYPINFEYDFSEDARIYSTILGNVGLALSVLRGEKLAGPASERQVFHGTTKGDVLYEGYLSFEHDVTTVSYFGRDNAVTRWKDFPATTLASGYPNDSSKHALSTGHRGHISSWNWYAEYILSQPTPHYIYGWTISGSTRTGHTTVLSIMGNFPNEREFIISYRQRVRRYHTNPAYYTECTVNTEMVVELTPGFFWKGSQNISESTLTIPPLSGGKVTITDSFSDWNRVVAPGEPPPVYGQSWGYQEKTLVSTYLLRPVLVGKYPQVPSDINVDLIVKVLRSEDDRLQLLADEYLSSAMVSASQAVAEFEDQSGLNYIESISEINQVAQLMPDTAPLERFLQLLPRRKLFSGAIKLLDFASNTYLLYKFGLQPFQKDLEAFSTVWDRVLANLATKMTNLELRGKFQYTFDSGPLRGYNLTTRSKVNVSFPSWSLTAAMLPYSQRGLSPTFENAWDLVTMSFVVDWFYNFDDKISFGESALHMLMAEAHYYVHSYKLVGPLPDTVLIEPLDASYAYYLRRRSAFFPYSSLGSVDWLGKTNGVPKLLGGALLWSILRP